jgi:hypothetical protein
MTQIKVVQLLAWLDHHTSKYTSVFVPSTL